MSAQERHRPALRSAGQARAERNAEIIRHRRAGVGPAVIARWLGVSNQTVAGVLFRAGLTSHRGGRGNGPNAEFLRLVRQQAQTMSKVAMARDHGVNRTTIYRWLEQAARLP